MIRIKRKNPTNYELLKNIRIVKEKLEGHPISEFARFRFYLGKEEIARADVEIDNRIISDILMDPKFQRKGLGTFIYDYVESKLNIKLKPSDYLSSKGEAFWKNRSRKQLLNVLKTRTNPTDKEFLSKVKIKKVLNKEYISYEAFYNNKYIAGVDFDPKTKTVWDVWVGPNYRRKGLATFIYNKIEKDQKIKLKPSETLFPDGQEFWKARLKTG